MRYAASLYTIRMYSKLLKISAKLVTFIKIKG
ncbi:hypothetical protein PCC9214_05641 [Planktothrix tepida]|nr:hypothetical protein PCC9214_05641 [Planktothrix tepida]